VCNAKYNAHSEPLFKECNILPLPDLIVYFNLQFIHNFKFNHSPESFEDVWRTVGETRREQQNFEQCELRNDEDFIIPASRTAQTESQPLINLPKTWNNFQSETLKTTSNKHIFNKNLKIYLLNNLSTVPNCTRGNCPNCVTET